LVLSGVVMAIALTLATLCLLAFPVLAVAAEYACATKPDLVGPCHEVRGRLYFWNGAPSARIWRVGTTRMLGIHYDELPPDLASRITGFDTEAWGLFNVCSFTKQRRRRMQSVASSRGAMSRFVSAPTNQH